MRAWMFPLTAVMLGLFAPSSGLARRSDAHAKGLALLRKGQLEKAHKLLVAAQNKATQNLEISYDLARVFARLGRRNEAGKAIVRILLNAASGDARARRLTARMRICPIPKLMPVTAR